MQIVINLEDNFYETIKNNEFNVYGGRVYETIRNGIPLPKGHGRIGDLDKLIRATKERNDDNGGYPLNAVDRGYDLAYQHMVKESKDCVIIRAESEE